MPEEEITITIPAKCTAAAQRAAYHRKLIHIRGDYVNGKETLAELAARYSVNKGDLTRKCNKEGWRAMREKAWANMQVQAERKFSKKREIRQRDFIEDTHEMMGKAKELIDREFQRQKDQIPDSLGNPVNTGDLVRVIKSLEIFVNVGRKIYVINAPLPSVDSPVNSQDSWEVEPIFEADVVGETKRQDQFKIEAPETEELERYEAA